MNLYSSKEMTALLEKNDFFFKKNFGQNFLMNEAIAKRIATASLDSMKKNGKKLVLEIGPGAGALTLQLSSLFDQVIALEIDPHLIPVLDESLAECTNVRIIRTDALQFDYNTIAEEFPSWEIAVCSNLPYYITSELIMRLLECDLTISSITVLIQKEAANRLVSKPGSADFGAITAAVSYYAKAEKLFLVGPGNFIPRPKVDSAVLKLTPFSTPPVKVKDQKLFFKIIRSAFSARRKTLSNALSNGFKELYEKSEIERLLREAGIDPTRRGESLSLDEFAKISDKFSNIEE